MNLSARAAGVAVLLMSTLAAGCNDSPVEPSSPSAVPYSITELRAGTGAEAVSGSVATVSYTLWLYSPTTFDGKGTRIESGSFSFTIGAGNVIQGFSVGVTGMRVGGARRLIVPPSLAYGAGGTGQIPPNATLVFDVELLDVQ